VSQTLGTPLVRKEDPALLSGRGRYADDLPIANGTLHAHVIRSPHPHAKILRIDAAAALALPGVTAVITGEDIGKLTDPFLIALKQPVHQWSLAVERVRYVGEAVALVVADSRYVAEDAAELVEVDYEPVQAVIDPLAACAKSAPLLHPACKTNEISVRKFAYGDTAAAFAAADRTIALTVDYPRLSFTPMECYVVVAAYQPHDDSYDVLANFQGPFSTHPVMAKALRVPGARLRLRIPPDSGGSFGIKLSVFPYIVLAAIAAKITGRPVKWVEDRTEHLAAASSGPNRITRIEAAVTREGRILGLRLDQLEDYGAFLRAPMPGPLYRMHGSVTGAYDIPNVEVTNRIVLTNKMPASLIRGFGGPQLYLAIERLVQRIALELGLDHLDVIRRNLIPTEQFPYRTAAGALYDSGDYARAVATTIGDGRLDDLKRRRDAARAAGKLYGIGLAAVVEPGMSNMGYLSTLLTADARERAGPKNGAVSMVTVTVDPLGAVSVTADVTVQGQGHQTVLSQIVADRLGLDPADIKVTLEMDTAKDAWSIAAGTYSCRFSPGTAVAAHLAAVRMRDKLAGIAANQLNILPDDIEFADGQVRSRSNPDNALPFGRVAGTAHWSPAMLPDGMPPGLSETGVWSPPELEPPTTDDRINTSLTYGFVFDMCGVEVDPVTFSVRVDRYVSMHDAGTLLNPLIADGQVHGAFAQGIAAALYEEFVYDENGNFLSGSFADYLVPTVSEIPKLEILHQETPSPLTPLGAKGMAEGNCMSTPACIANAVADALGVKDISLPLTPLRLHALMAGEEVPLARAATPVSSPSPQSKSAVADFDHSIDGPKPAYTQFRLGEGRGGGSGSYGTTLPPLPTPTPDPSPAEPRYSEGSATQQSDRSRQQPTSVGGGEHCPPSPP
jgi:2-furoyl-CoA dehydrogenase large subunit